MQPFDKLTLQMIKGNTPKEKHDNLRKLMKACFALCYPRRGTWEAGLTIEDLQEIVEPCIPTPSEFEAATDTKLN